MSQGDKSCGKCGCTGKRGRGNCRECLTWRSWGYEPGVVPGYYVPLGEALNAHGEALL